MDYPQSLQTLDLTDPRNYRVDQTEPASNEAKRLFDYIAKEMEGRSHSLFDFPQYNTVLVTELMAKLLFVQRRWNNSWMKDYGVDPITKDAHDWLLFTPSGAVDVRIGATLLS